MADLICEQPLVLLQLTMVNGVAGGRGIITHAGYLCKFDYTSCAIFCQQSGAGGQAYIAGADVF